MITRKKCVAIDHEFGRITLHWAVVELGTHDGKLYDRRDLYVSVGDEKQERSLLRRGEVHVTSRDGILRKRAHVVPVFKE